MFFKKIISTKIGILIVVICALLAGGILAWQYFEVQKYEVPPIKFPPKSEQKITVATDRTEYEQGEEIIWNPVNYKFGELYLLTESCNKTFTTAPEIEKYKNGTWQKVTWFNPANKLCEMVFTDCARLKTDFSRVVKTEYIDFNNNEILLDGGIYRIKATFGKSCSYNDEEKTGDLKDIFTVYSNEFTIKEKSAVDPRCSQKVEFDQMCAPGSLVKGYEFDSGEGKCIEKQEIACPPTSKTPFNSLEECQRVCEISVGEELPFETIENVNWPGIGEKKNYVIKNKEDWQEIWANAGHSAIAPEIDFTKEMIIAAFYGVAATGGYNIEITKIIESADKLEVFVKETSPGKGCIVIKATTEPRHIIKLQKSDKEVIFKTEKVVTNCQ